MRGWLVIRATLPLVSWKLDGRTPWVLAGLLASAGGVFALYLGIGEYPIPPLDVLKNLLGLTEGEHDFIIRTLRLPRALGAVLVGAGLGVSGVILQALTRNPLASPEVVGLSGGASLAAATALVIYPQFPVFLVPPAAFIGALAAAAAAYLLAWRGGSSPLRLVLVGIGISAIAHALVTLVITYGNIYRVNEAMLWMAGTMYGRSWEHLGSLVPWLLAGLPVALALSRDLDVLNLGDDLAYGLGVKVELKRGALLLTSAALAAASIATGGAIGFVGLMAPHMARRLTGPAHQGLVLTAGLLGGLIVLAADLLGRWIFAPIEIPCGVITATVGAPFFIYLLYRKSP